MEIFVTKIKDINDRKLEKTCSWIDEEKRYRIKKFINKKDKIRTLIGELLVRTLTNKKLKIGNERIVWGKNHYGKPYLKGYPNYYFNISHSGEFVVCAISNNPVGIDIEQIKHIEYEEIAKSFFCDSEYAYIQKGDVNYQLRKFYEVWTLKESYIKCYGSGLSMSLKSFSINIDSHKAVHILFDNREKSNSYSMAIFDIELEYKMAVCSLNEEISSNITVINQDIIINDFYKLLSDRGAF
ncbi:TPA: 4'-phosphopantetheinyl transferase superfamily protein [Bacillus cereus]